MTPDLLARARALDWPSLTILEAAASLGVGRTTVYKVRALIGAPPAKAPDRRLPARTMAPAERLTLRRDGACWLLLGLTGEVARFRAESTAREVLGRANRTLARAQAPDLTEHATDTLRRALGWARDRRLRVASSTSRALEGALARPADGEQRRMALRAVRMEIERLQGSPALLGLVVDALESAFECAENR